jgi:hypothetical protein
MRPGLTIFSWDSPKISEMPSGPPLPPKKNLLQISIISLLFIEGKLLDILFLRKNVSVYLETKLDLERWVNLLFIPAKYSFFGAYFSRS